MPFKRVTTGKNKGKYKSTSGKLYSKEQMKLYHATKGFRDKPKKKKKEKVIITGNIGNRGVITYRE